MRFVAIKIPWRSRAVPGCPIRSAWCDWRCPT